MEGPREPSLPLLGCAIAVVPLASPTTAQLLLLMVDDEHKRACARACVCACVCVRTCVRGRVCVREYGRACECACMRTGVHAYVCACAHVFVSAVFPLWGIVSHTPLPF